MPRPWSRASPKAATPPIAHAVHAATGLCGSFTCPVRAGDQLFGTLEFYFKTPLDDAAPELDTVRGLALQLGDFIARRDAEARLRNEREHARPARRGAHARAQRNQPRARRSPTVGAEDASRAKSSSWRR